MMKITHVPLLGLALSALHVTTAKPLLLTPLIEAGKLKEARTLSKVAIAGRNLGHSGFFAVPSTSGTKLNQLFAWFQPCLEGCEAGAAPFIQYFNGGPGSPDSVGAMNQVGNWYVDKNYQLQERCFSWCRHNNCLFVDQPVLTGFSFQTNRDGAVGSKTIEYTLTSAEAADQVLQVLLQFLQIWPEYTPAPYYVHGLSYGGHYVPWMAKKVLEHNKADKRQINIQGIAAGDPCMDNKVQYPTTGATMSALGLLMEDEREVVDAIMANATALNDVDCVQSFHQWNRLWHDDGGSSCEPNCEFLFQRYTGSSNTENFILGAQPDNFDFFRKFLSRHADNFHATETNERTSTFAEGGEVYFAMVKSGDFCAASAPLYTELFLKERLDVIVYSANLDVLLGPPTAAAGVKAAWDYAEKALHGGAEAKKAFYSQRKSIWRVEENDVNPAGYSKCLLLDGRRFCNVIVRNAGHEAAGYQPRSTYDLNERFMHHVAFDAKPYLRTPRILPTCHQCEGAPPLTGAALPACSNPVPMETTLFM